MSESPPNGGVRSTQLPAPATSAGISNYFVLLNTPPSFEINLQALEAAYFAAQKQYHPDRFIGKPTAERQAALQRSADINQAYDTLKNPFKRAQYVLQLQNITIGTEQDSIKPSPALLMETMEWRERIAEAHTLEAIKPLAEELDKFYARSIKILANTYMFAQWPEMAQETLRLGYIIKAQEALTLQKIRAEKQA